MGIDYKSAGVDVEAGYKAVNLIKRHVKATFDKNVLGDLGSFGGVYALDDRQDGDVLVAGTDGVGTKLKYAFAQDCHNTIGIDAVAMCVNDVVCLGAKPLFFLDYIAIPKLIPEKVEQIVAGVAAGCTQAGCALIGGETAEMPGFYADGEYDIAGFACGIAKRDKLITGADIKIGDKLIGLASSGTHSNGYSLLRKLFGTQKEQLAKYNDELGADLAQVLLTPTKIYVKSILALLEKVKVKGLCHITGGGFIENIPRILNKNQCACINTSAYPVPKIFDLVQRLSGLEKEKMYNTFNMGIGMIAVVAPQDVEGTIAVLQEHREQAYLIGEVQSGQGVKLC